MTHFQTWYDSVDLALDKYRRLRDLLMSLDTQSEVRAVVRANKSWFRNNPGAYSLVENANMRIRRIHIMQMKSWKLNLN